MSNKSIKKSIKTEFNIELGRRLKELRLRHGMSQTEFGEIIEVTVGQIFQYERGNNRLSACNVDKICDYFNISPMYFFAKGESK